MIPYSNRFHGHNALSYVYKNGQVIRSRVLSLRYIKNSHRKNSRIAVVVSKKVLKSAVKRNRVRRRLYEHARLLLPRLNDVYDIVFIVSSNELLNMTHTELVSQIDQTFDNSGMLKTNKTV